MRVAITLLDAVGGPRSDGADSALVASCLRRRFEHADVSCSAGVIFVYSRGRDMGDIASAARCVLEHADLLGTVDVAHWDGELKRWLSADGSGSYPDGDIPEAADTAGDDESRDDGLGARMDEWAHRHTRTFVVAVFVAGAIGMMLLAGAGVVWFVVSPGVASYNLGALMCLPAVFAASVGLELVLPDRVAWVAAVVIAAGGAIAYVELGGDNLWFIGQFAAFPILVKFWARYPDGPDMVVGEGPWGPP